MKTFRKLNLKQRNFMADKLMDSGNYALASLVFGSFTERLNYFYALSGAILYATCWLISMQLKGKKHA